MSDVVLRRGLPPRLRELVGLWTGCVAGALVDTDYRTTHVHRRADLEHLAAHLDLPDDLDTAEALDQIDGVVTNAFVRARRPA